MNRQQIKIFNNTNLNQLQEDVNNWLNKCPEAVVEECNYSRCMDILAVLYHLGSDNLKYSDITRKLSCVAKDKKYLVELDGLVTTDGAKQYLTKKDGKWFASRRMSGLHQGFTDEELNKAPKWVQQLNREEMTAEIERNGLQDCEKEAVADVSNETKHWYVKTPDNWMGNRKQGWLYKITGVINTLSEDRRECTQDEQFTTEEIKKYHLDGFKKEEVTDDEQ